jgi:hypothetical protein
MSGKGKSYILGYWYVSLNLMFEKLHENVIITPSIQITTD